MVVIPLFQRGNIAGLNQYSSISLSPVFAKVFEKILSHQLSHYLESNDILCGKQFGFRNGKNTTMTILDLVNDIAGCYEKGLYALATFLDLIKASDYVSHITLLRKLYVIILHPTSCALLSSYVSNRRQIVCFNKWHYL